MSGKFKDLGADRIYLSPPHMGPDERSLLLDAFDSNWIAPLGPHVNGFERELGEYAGVDHVAALSSGTAALHLALLILGVEPGDTVFCSTLTFAATVNPVRYIGATPVFIDSNRETWNMDPDLLREALDDAARGGNLPKAVIAVDLYGQCADYDPILEACAQYGVPLIEDAAEALGADYKGKKAGSFGAMGVFSFNGNKIITTSGGGALVSDNQAWIERARFLATQARDPAPHYQHSTIGFNYRLSNLLAAVGRGQLRVLDERVRARRGVNARYQEALGHLDGIDFMPEADYGQSNRWLTTAIIDERRFGCGPDQIREALAEQNIEARPVWKPMHLQPIFKDYPIWGGIVAEQLFEHGICLPSGSDLTVNDQERIVAVILATRETLG